MLILETTGMWWDPRAPDEEWHGTLRFDDVLGSTLSITLPNEVPDFSPALRSYPVLHGRGSNGKLYSLLDAFDRSTQPSLFGVPRSVEVFANRLIAGFHSASTDPLLSAVSVEFENLTDWFGQTGISMDQSVVFPEVAARYKPPVPNLLYEDDLLTVTLEAGAGYGIGEHKFDLKEAVWFSIQAKDVLPFSHFDKVARACGDLLSIACMVNCRTSNFTLIAPAIEDQPRSSATFHAVPRYKRRPSEPTSVTGRVLFSFDDIKSRAAAIFRAWLTKDADLRDARALYFEGLYGGSFVEHRLLVLVQAAEAFHRRFYQGTFMPAADFESQVLQPMVAAIPMHISTDFKATLKKRLQHANERSQRSRLNELVKEHNSTLEVLAAEPKQLVNPIIDVRNEFTHFPVPVTGSSAAERPPAQRVLYYNWFLRLLLEAAFLGSMGFEKDEIRAMAEGSETYRQIAARFAPSSRSE